MNKIADIRKARGMSQERLAEAAGVPRTHLSAIENDELRPRIDTCQRIAVALDVTVDDIFPPVEKAS